MTDKHIPDLSKLSKAERAAVLHSLMATERAQQNRRASHRYTDQQISFMEKALAVFGLPAEANPRALAHTPVITYLTILVTSLVSLACLIGDETMFLELAFIPAYPFRSGGLTLLSCFLVHGGIGHLFINMYCLFVFGDNVEDVLRPVRYLLLLIAATLTGSLLSYWGSHGEVVPHVGASGGIFGVMVFYLLRFPKSHFTYFFFFHFFRVPALAVLATFLFMQLFGLLEQQNGVEHVDYLAHLGGGIAGLAFWLINGRNKADTPEHPGQ